MVDATGARCPIFDSLGFEQVTVLKSAQALANLQKRGGNTSLAHYNQMLGGAVVFLAISLGGAAVVISFERVPPWFLMCLAEPLFVGILMVVQHASAT